MKQTMSVMTMDHAAISATVSSSDFKKGRNSL